MVKKTTSFKLEPETMRRLKVTAAESGKTIGDVIEAFVLLHQNKAIPERLFAQALEIVSKPRTGWVGDAPEALRANFAHAAKLAREDGNEVAAAQFEKRMASLDAEFGPEEV